MTLKVCPKIRELRESFQFGDIYKFGERMTVLGTVITKILIAKVGQTSLPGAAEFLGTPLHSY